MFYKIEISKTVEDDIFDLTDYIYRFTFDKILAKQIYDELYRKIFSLDFLPNRHEEYLWEYRRIIVKWSYKIIYRVDEENKKVIVIRVIRGEQNKSL